MSSSVSTTNVQGVSAIAAQTTPPALSEAIAASKEEHPAAVSFANVVGKTKAPEMPEKTPDQIRKEALRKFVDEERAAGHVVGFCTIKPTHRIVQAARQTGEIPTVSENGTKKKKDSISTSYPDARFYVMKRSGEGRDGKPIHDKIVYVSFSMKNPSDAEEFQNRPIIVSEPLAHPRQKWTSEIVVRCVTVGLKKTAPPPKFGRSPSWHTPDPMVDAKKYADGLPDAYDPNMRMPRGFGPLWNVPQGSPHGKGRRCTKSGRDRDGNDKGPCRYNMEVVEALLLQGNKPPHSICHFNHFSIHDAGITSADAYDKILKPQWLETVAKMFEFEETKMEAKVAREERRDVARAAAAPDEDGFSTAISRAGHKTAKSIPKSEKSMKPTPAKTNGFAALVVANSEDEAGVTKTTITPTSKPEEKVAEAPKTQTQFKGKKKGKYVKIEGLSF